MATPLQSPSRLLLGALLLCSTAQGQIHDWSGDASNHIFGFSVDGIGDVNGDGYSEVIVGAPHVFSIGPGSTSYGRVFDGKTGALLYESDGGSDDDHRGHTVRGIGDFNGDDVPDFMVCSEPDFCFGWLSPAARIYSGASGALLAEPTVGNWYDFDEQSADGAGDVDGDGFDDVILGEPDGFVTLSDQGRAYVYGGPGGTLIREFAGTSANERFGQHVTGVGDWNGDGRDDVAISSALATHVFSVSDGAQLFVTSATGRVGDAGDFNGDGSRDLLIGGRLVSGADGSTLLQLTGWSQYRVGADINCDGTLDFLAADPSFNSGRGRIATLSGTDGALISVLGEGVQSGEHLGFELALAGDVNGDGIPDVVAGAPDAGAGTAYVFSGVSIVPSNYCVGAANSASPGGAVSGLLGSWSVAQNDLVLRVEDCPPSHAGIFFYGPAQTQTSFGNGFLCVTGGLTRLWPPLLTDATGTATLDVDLSSPPMSGGANPITGGTTYNFQFWYRDIPAGGAFFNLSNGLEITFCL